eukprot:scaffold1394_cov109-Isochrysis_galbana.AAC.7
MDHMDELGRLARRSKSPGAVDRTRYGLHRSCPPMLRRYIVHHMQLSLSARAHTAPNGRMDSVSQQRLSFYSRALLAVVFDANAITKGAISLKQQACHVRLTSGQLPAAVMGAMGTRVRARLRRPSLLSPPLQACRVAGASSWGVLCRSCCL